LNEQQVTELANILHDLKTERAQAEVDDRRTLGAFADAISGESFDEGRAKEGGELRTKSADRLRERSRRRSRAFMPCSTPNSARASRI